jgi:hypothetical protein
MYMEVAVRGLQIYLLVLLHKDQVHLWLGRKDITLLQVSQSGIQLPHLLGFSLIQPYLIQPVILWLLVVVAAVEKTFSLVKAVAVVLAVCSQEQLQ